MLAKSGFVGLLVLGGALYYSGAGSWMWARVEKLEPACYQGLAEMGGSVANPVCGGIGQAVRAMDQLAEDISQQVKGWRLGNLLGSGENPFQAWEQQARQGIAGLSSSADYLNRLLQAGPKAISGGNAQQQFQTAIDSFTIGQHFLANGSSGAQALPWFEQGAAQPEGMGLMSQISLASMYGTGTAGIPADPAAARRYLQQANQSLSLLMTSEAPQARQMLGALNTNPRVLKQQIESALRQ